MKQVIYGESLQRDPVWFARAQQAMAFLESISVRMGGDVVAECQLNGSLEVRLSDATGTSSVTLGERDFLRPSRYEARIHRVWGDFLHSRLQSMVSRLMVGSSVMDEE